MTQIPVTHPIISQYRSARINTDNDAGLVVQHPYRPPLHFGAAAAAAGGVLPIHGQMGFPRDHLMLEATSPVDTAI
jgi:hypothetical protein